MAMTLNEDQSMLRDSARDFMAAEAPPAHFRKYRDMACKDGFSHDLWKQFAEMGFTGILIPEAEGGLGMGHIEAGAGFQQLAGEVVRAAGAGRAEEQPGAARFRMRHQLRHIARRYGGVDQQHQLVGEHQRNRREILHRIERHAGVDAAVDRMGADGAHQQVIAIRRRLGHRFRADIAAGAAAVDHHDRLAQGLAELLGHCPSQQVGGTARGIGHHKIDRPGRVALGERRRRG